MSLKNDVYNVWDGENFAFTLGKICAIIGAEMPEEYKAYEDQLIKHFGYKKIVEKATDNGILFDAKPKDSRRDSIVESVGKGVFLVSDKEYFDNDGKPLARIDMDARNAWIYLGQYIKSVFPMPTIGITGSVGKTTSTMFADCVFSEKYNTFLSSKSGKNHNGPRTIVQKMILNYCDEYDFHIQECGGGGPQLIDGLAEMLSVDAFGITTINTFHHIDLYGSAENIIADKTSFDDHAKPNTFGVINLDDEILKAHPFKCRTVTFAINDETADYVGKNIVQNGEFLEFDVDDHEKTVHIVIEIAGKHNVYNALMVFAFAREFGVTDEQIQTGFKKYSSGLIRQAVKSVSGRQMYIDCFNVCSESIRSCCDTLQEFEVSKKNRKIAIIGGENALGENSYRINFETGVSLAKYDDIDKFYFIGPKEPATEQDYNFFGNGKAVYEGAKTVLAEEKLCFVDDLESLTQVVKSESQPGDAVMFKGIFRLPLFAAIDKAFGTSYIINNANFKGTPIAENGFTGDYYEELEGVNITKFSGDDEAYKDMVIPAVLDGKKVLRIDSNTFYGKKKKINTLVIEEGVQTIAKNAFWGCTLMTDVSVPSTLIRIEDNAFTNCFKIEELKLTNVQDIGSTAFRNCRKLKKIILSENCKYIAEDAFEGCSGELVIVAPRGSYGRKFAKEHNMAEKTIMDKVSKKLKIK